VGGEAIISAERELMLSSRLGAERRRGDTAKCASPRMVSSHNDDYSQCSTQAKIKYNLI